MKIYKYAILINDINNLSFSEITRSGIENLIYRVIYESRQYFVNTVGSNYARIGKINDFGYGVVYSIPNKKCILFDTKVSARAELYRLINNKLTELRTKVFKRLIRLSK